ncbi:hypothetical protein Tco_0709840 [Tanacetum coccineum]
MNDQNAMNEFEDGIVIHMLVERRYPLSKALLQRMLDLGLEVERESSGFQLTLLHGEELASPRSNSSCTKLGKHNSQQYSPPSLYGFHMVDGNAAARMLPKPFKLSLHTNIDCSVLGDVAISRHVLVVHLSLQVIFDEKKLGSS